MPKNRFAQPLYGKIIYIFETDLKMEELSTIFSPKTYWIDVTGIDCEVGYIQEFREGEGIVWVVPPNKEYTFEDEKARKLEAVDVWTKSKITGGFVCYCYNNEPVRYDTDEETQLTMTKARANCQSEKFAVNFPTGMPCRGYVKVDEARDGTPIFATEKTILLFTPEQIIAWDEDFSLFLAKCKGEGWIKQAEVAAATTKEDLDSIILD